MLSLGFGRSVSPDAGRCMSLIVLTDYLGRKVRLTAERRQHILQHLEMVEWGDKKGIVLWQKNNT
jgi:hypothetical protein